MPTDELTSHGHGVSISISSAGNHSHTIYGDYSNGTHRYIDNVKENTYQNEAAAMNACGDAGSHGHTATGSIAMTGGNKTHENRPPYQAVNRWMRTA